MLLGSYCSGVLVLQLSGQCRHSAQRQSPLPLNPLTAYNDLAMHMPCIRKIKSQADLQCTAGVDRVLYSWRRQRLSLCSQQTFAFSATTCKGFHSTLHCLCKTNCQSLSLPLPLDFDFDCRLQTADCWTAPAVGLRHLTKTQIFEWSLNLVMLKLGCAIPNSMFN